MKKLKRKSQLKAILFFIATILISTVLFGLILGFGVGIIERLHIGEFFIFLYVMLCIAVLLIITAFSIRRLIRKLKQPLVTAKNVSKLPPVSKEREAHYKSRGLSDEDIVFFRETMNKAKSQILVLEDNFRHSVELRKIAVDTSVISISQTLFKEIVKAPERLSDVDEFLYVNLPSVMDLTTKYLQIDEHQAKSDSAIEIMRKSLPVIHDMCEQIIEDYVNFMEDDIKDMSQEVELAKRRLKNHQNSSVVFNEDY